MESRLDAAAEPSHVLSQFAPTRLSQGAQGQPLNLSASTSRHINPLRTAFVPRLAFPSSTTIPLFHPCFSPRTRTRRGSAIPLGFISEAGAGTTLRESTYPLTLHATWALRIANRHTRLLANIASTSRHYINHQGECSTMVGLGSLACSPSRDVQNFNISLPQRLDSAMHYTQPLHEAYTPRCRSHCQPRFTDKP